MTLEPVDFRTLVRTRTPIYDALWKDRPYRTPEEDAARIQRNISRMSKHSIAPMTAAIDDLLAGYTQLCAMRAAGEDPDHTARPRRWRHRR